MDLEPPQVTVSAPPVSEGSFTVAWDGDDGDGSGIVAYQVDYQDNGGPWKTLFTETLELEAPFSGELYHEYTFRVRARDLVGHTSDWITTTVAIVNQTKYYFLDGRRVAMRKGDQVFYLYGDHLGSTSLTTDENGVKLSEDRYLPYGSSRLIDGISPTDFGFTDQRNEVGLGLIDYHARYYDPYLGQFISPDPIVPDPSNPRSFNRYAYVYNNPIRYTDPSGHCIFGLDTAVCVVVGVLVVSAAVWVSMEMPVGEEAPPHNPGAMYTTGAKTGVKWGADTVGDAYALYDEYPENVGTNVVAMGIPLVSAGLLKAARRAYNSGGKEALEQFLIKHNATDYADEISMGVGVGRRIAGTRGLEHSFDEHAPEWFGRRVGRTTHMQAWQDLIERAAQSNHIVEWTTRGQVTIGHLAYIEDKYFFVQFYREGERAGQIATAFVPDQDQLRAIQRKLGRIP